MAITDFSSLKTAVLSWAARSDLSAYGDDFVALAETAINYGTDNTEALRVREMEDDVTITAESDGTYTIPTDYLQPRFARIGDCGLDYVVPEKFHKQSTSGTPEYFTINGSKLEVDGTSTSGLKLYYYKAVPALSSNNTTNWLLTKHPNIYLRLCLMELFLFIRDQGQADINAGMASRFINGLNNSDEMANYANASMLIEGAV